MKILCSHFKSRIIFHLQLKQSIQTSTTTI